MRVLRSIVRGIERFRCTIRRLKLTESSEHSFHGICAFWFFHCLEILFLVHSTVVVYATHGHGFNYCLKFHGIAPRRAC